jgi:hypothetical protein
LAWSGLVIVYDLFGYTSYDWRLGCIFQMVWLGSTEVRPFANGG